MHYSNNLFPYSLTEITQTESISNDEQENAGQLALRKSRTVF